MKPRHNTTSMTQPARRWTAVLIIAIALPLTCCGLPLMLLSLTAPTRWDYECEYQYPPEADADGYIRGVQIRETKWGPEDYVNNFYDPVGTREIKVHARRAPEDTSVQVRLLQYSLRSSNRGVLSTHDLDALPSGFSFTVKITEAEVGYWTANRPVITDLPSGEVLTSEITIEITREGVASIHTIRVVCRPVSRKEGPLYWLPSV
jgi:hypothetical protein